MSSVIEFDYNSDKSEVLKTMIPVELTGNIEHTFMQVREILTRVGVPNYNGDSLTQTAYIVRVDDTYYIAHFKSLFAYKGKKTFLTGNDTDRLELIVKFLEQWKLAIPKEKSFLNKQFKGIHIKIVNFADKKDWNLVSNYTLKNHIL